MQGGQQLPFSLTRLNKLGQIERYTKSYDLQRLLTYCIETQLVQQLKNDGFVERHYPIGHHHKTNISEAVFENVQGKNNGEMTIFSFN